MKIQVLNLGRADYLDVLELQRKLQRLRIEGKIGNVLILVEHNPVLTLGVKGQFSNIILAQNLLEKNGVKIVEVERGGDVTYHGPGQLVAYPIFDLSDMGKDIRHFLSNLQEVIVRYLYDDHKITAEKKTGTHTGVWIGSKKIAAIGISAKKWVTMHGFAFNVNTDLEHFKWIIPCGLKDSGVTSVKALTGKEVPLDVVADRFISYFSEIFDAEIEKVSLEELLSN